MILMIEAIIPVGDMSLILAAKGSTRIALGIHGVTAALMILAAIPLLTKVCLKTREADAKRFFLKKEAKTFAQLSRTRQRVRDSLTRVFWFFFAKKNCFLPCRHKKGPGCSRAFR